MPCPSCCSQAYGVPPRLTSGTSASPPLQPHRDKAALPPAPPTDEAPGFLSLILRRGATGRERGPDTACQACLRRAPTPHPGAERPAVHTSLPQTQCARRLQASCCFPALGHRSLLSGALQALLHASHLQGPRQGEGEPHDTSGSLPAPCPAPRSRPRPVRRCDQL